MTWVARTGWRTLAGRWFTVVALLPLAVVSAATEARRLDPVGAGKTGFTLMNPESTGVHFTNVLRGDAFLTNAVAHNGSGVALGDIDGDGWVDLYFCSLQGPNRLYRNRGQWRFEEVDPGAAACLGQLSTGATFADVDGDGDLDLLVNGIAAGTRLFLNDGKGKFTEAVDSGLSRTASPMSLALADIDGDGDLDLYCAHYIDVTHLADPTTQIVTQVRAGRPVVQSVNGQRADLSPWKDRFEVSADGSIKELPEVDGIYRNDGYGHFTAIQMEPGVFQDEHGKPIAPYRDWGLSVMFRDLNGDGAPDICVANDNASPVRVWINNGKGTFRELPANALRHTSRSTMGVDFADLDRDGRDDFILLDMLAREPGKRMTQLGKTGPSLEERESSKARPGFNRNTLFFGRPDGTFAEAALWAGVAATDWSWCPIFLDVDLDGYEDLLISNGFEQDVLDQDTADQFRLRQWTPGQVKRYRGSYPAWRTPNAAFRNRGDGTFEAVSSAWGFDQSGVSQGMAVADLDNDGDLDVVINNLNGVASILRNDSPAPRIAVRLKGQAANTQGTGARLRLTGGAVSQSQEMICGGRYLSGDQAMRVFAATPLAGQPLRLEIRWRDGRESVVSNALPNHRYEVDQREATALPRIKPDPLPQPYFIDVSERLGHRWVESAHEDWARQPLLTRRLSRLGPGVCWYDLNGDGWDDLVLPAARGGRLAVFINDGGKKFTFLAAAQVNAGNQGAVLGWPDGKGNRQVLIAQSNDEMPPGAESRVSSLSDTLAPREWSAGNASLGPLAAADIDGDGKIDVFVGGRFKPGRYPEAGASQLWFNENGELRANPARSHALDGVGPVNAATFVDLDGDGAPELILAIEGGPVRVLGFAQARLEDRTAVWGLGAQTGFWTSVTAGDYDGDGRMDLAVGNRGRNTLAELYRPSPVRIYYGDWNGDGAVQLLEAGQKDGRWWPTANRLWLGNGLPELPARYATHAEFGRATIPDILGPRLEKSGLLEVNELASGIYLNRGNHFEWVPLPREAQWSTVYALNVGDLDGDGIEDLFASQNFLGGASDLTREDSGTGLWLRGTGQGRFTAMDARLTGIHLLGEQRGAALADFDHDGRIDLAVAQNDGVVGLFLNRLAKPGLRVVLRGPSGNPTGIGAQMRVGYGGERQGPCRCVQAGSGYWSQDGSSPILGLAEAPVKLWIRWPGGKEQTVPLDAAAREIVVDFKP